MVARSWSYGCHSLCTPARHQAAMDRTYHGTPADQGRGCCTCQQDRTHGLGHDGKRRAVQGAYIAARSGIGDRLDSTNWRGHDDVMQIRSFRGSGEPAWVTALPSACKRLGPDPRRALGPAAIRAALTGRTLDRTRPMLQKRQKVLARAPSTRDP